MKRVSELGKISAEALACKRTVRLHRERKILFQEVAIAGEICRLGTTERCCVSGGGFCAGGKELCTMGELGGGLVGG